MWQSYVFNDAFCIETSSLYFWLIIRACSGGDNGTGSHVKFHICSKIQPLLFSSCVWFSPLDAWLFTLFFTDWIFCRSWSLDWRRLGNGCKIRYDTEFFITTWCVYLIAVQLVAEFYLESWINDLSRHEHAFKLLFWG